MSRGRRRRQRSTKHVETHIVGGWSVRIVEDSSNGEHWVVLRGYGLSVRLGLEDLDDLADVLAEASDSSYSEGLKPEQTPRVEVIEVHHRGKKILPPPTNERAIQALEEELGL